MNHDSNQASLQFFTCRQDGFFSRRGGLKNDIVKTTILTQSLLVAA
jgi:hypothetical protein